MPSGPSSEFTSYTRVLSYDDYVNQLEGLTKVVKIAEEQIQDLIDVETALKGKGVSMNYLAGLINADLSSLKDLITETRGNAALTVTGVQVSWTPAGNRLATGLASRTPAGFAFDNSGATITATGYTGGTAPPFNTFLAADDIIEVSAATETANDGRYRISSVSTNILTLSEAPVTAAVEDTAVITLVGIN